MAPRLPQLNGHRPLRVLYSFPHKLGADRICHLAWQQVAGLAAAGVEVTAMPGALQPPVPPGARLAPTLARGPVRIPYRLLGVRRACQLHDWIVARRLRAAPETFDLVHAWPLGARRTLQAARACRVPVLLERPNAHTRFAYAVVARECAKVGMQLEAGHEHAWKEDWLRIEEEEFAAADALLCPSDFVLRSFWPRVTTPHACCATTTATTPPAFSPSRWAERRRPLHRVVCRRLRPRKGLHYALEAWRRSGAGEQGQLLVAGEFVPGYARCLGTLINQPGVTLLGHRRDVPDLMRRSDVLVLPSIEEGSALVTSEARACGCVLAVSDASGALCNPGEDALVHPVGDVETLTAHFALLSSAPDELARLRSTSLRSTASFSWRAAGETLARVYGEFLARRSAGTPLVAA
jgi:glycosyltransferase involved in cell wall biosynthesis